MTRRLWPALLGLLAFTLPTILTSSATVAATPLPEALLVGDSVMSAMAQTYGAPARAQLAARHSFLLDAKGCRRLITTSCSIGSSPPPTNALTVIRAMAGQYRTALVVAVGYNDATTGTGGLTTAVDVILAEARAQGVPYVVWLTYREAGASAGKYRADNAVLRTKAAADPMLVIADWAARSARLPTSWFSADGIHLGADAAKAMAGLIADTLDLLPQRPDPSACLITDTTVAVADAVATAGGTALDEGAQASQTAARLNLRCPD
jgi:hypothetical protein